MAASVFVVPAAAQQAFSGRLSDSTCGASHRAKAASSTTPGADALTDRQCLISCINALSKYVLVDERQQVIPIANQDAMGLPLYAARPVKITGERQGAAVLVTKVEAIPAHLHIGHVMTNWRDTPGTRGFLPVAIDEARVAVQHARLAAKGARLEDIQLQAGHALSALDPAAEPGAPGAAGYGVRKAVTGARQHLDFAAKAEGATPSLTTQAGDVSSLLSTVQQSIDQAIAAAQKVRAAREAAEATGVAADLAALTERISEGLQQAQARMAVLLKAEGLAGVPR